MAAKQARPFPNPLQSKAAGADLSGVETDSPIFDFNNHLCGRLRQSDTASRAVAMPRDVIEGFLNNAKNAALQLTFSAIEVAVVLKFYLGTALLFANRNQESNRTQNTSFVHEWWLQACKQCSSFVDAATNAFASCTQRLRCTFGIPDPLPEDHLEELRRTAEFLQQSVMDLVRQQFSFSC